MHKKKDYVYKIVNSVKTVNSYWIYVRNCLHRCLIILKYEIIKKIILLLIINHEIS